MNPVEQVFNCRGAVGGDVVAMVMHAGDPSRDIPFMEACEIINGCPAPKRNTQVKLADPELLKERREERRQVELTRSQKEEQERLKRRAQCVELFESCRPLAGTHGDAYFRRRLITMTQEMAVDIRFAPELKFFGNVEGKADLEHLGDFPCVVSAIRNLLTDEIIGIHRTYLDPKEPAKLKPPGVGNKAKKVFGEWKGGGIRMSPIREAMAAGEGIETCASWYGLGKGPDDIGLVCAVAIDNLSGAATGSLPHPRPTATGAKTIQNGVPNMEEPGLILPPEVRSIYLLGDGDSDPYATRAKLLTGERRYRALGLEAFIHMAPSGADWNSVVTGVGIKRAA
ncbi:hypothetical protein OIU35_31700 [Boseaceae bacterium BT-24-1]|nr:hypothetical protein [Boseaceae bacterium BT-24-1]